MSDSVWPHRRQPTRLPHPWGSPGKNTGVGCHYLLQCMKVKSESEVAQSCSTLSDPMDCSLPGSSIHGIFQARVLEWGAIAFSELHEKHKLRMQMWQWKLVINSQETFFFVLTQLQILDKFTCCPSEKSGVYFLYPMNSCVNISLLIITWGSYNIPQL